MRTYPRARSRSRPARREPAEPGLVGLGPDLEVVVDHRRLAVEQEAAERGVGLEQSSISSSRLTSRIRNVWNGGTTPGPSGCAGRRGRCEASVQRRPMVARRHHRS